MGVGGGERVVKFVCCEGFPVVSSAPFLLSLLSHSAVVARELGLPTIVGVSGGLMKRLTVRRHHTGRGGLVPCSTMHGL